MAVNRTPLPDEEKIHEGGLTYSHKYATCFEPDNELAQKIREAVNVDDAISCELPRSSSSQA